MSGYSAPIIENLVPGRNPIPYLRDFHNLPVFTLALALLRYGVGFQISEASGFRSHLQESLGTKKTCPGIDQSR